MAHVAQNNAAFPDGTARYLREIHRFPLLSQAEEQDLSHRWQQSQDRDAAHRLVTSHLRLVAKIAAGYRGYGLPLSELIAEGNIGMMQALNRFDPDRGFRLSTYAMWWIRAAIHEYILHSWSLVKTGTTASQKKLFFNLRRLKAQMRLIDDGELPPPHAARIADMLKVPEQDVLIMNRRLAAHDVSLNAPIGPATEDEWIDWLPDASPSQETLIGDHEELSGRMALLPQALKTLSPRELHILTERRLKDHPVTLDALSSHYGVSRERIRQLEMRAFEKLRKSITQQMHDHAQNSSCTGAERRMASDRHVAAMRNIASAHP